MERQFEISIEKLRKKILKMSSLVDEQIDSAFKAIEDEDNELAEQVILNDKKVNKQDRKVEKICQKIIALNQPVAMDLRLIISALTISTNLERIGDLAKNIAESVLEMDKKPDFLNETKYFEMVKVAKEMFRDAIDAFNLGDLELAKKVIESDDILDDLYTSNRLLLIDKMKENCENVSDSVLLLEISRHLERIGDQSTNIAEDVYFIVEAQIVKHKYEKYIYSQMEEDEPDDEEN